MHREPCWFAHEMHMYVAAFLLLVYPDMHIVRNIEIVFVGTLQFVPLGISSAQAVWNVYIARLGECFHASEIKQNRV